MAECITIQVVSGDSCGSLAVRCGITAAQFTEYNPSPTLCSTLAVGEHVCCSSGSLPDYSPQPYANGTCYTYTVQSGDYCDEIAAEYSITVDLIDTYNNQTWGWLGCSDLQADQNICLSTGNPPFPAPVNNAVCGPQVPGTQPGDISSWELLNPCPLNACCDIWGQCGTTPEFCTATVSSTGNPGTAATGTNGCISNCGTDIVNNSTGPEIYASVGYFEGFNTQRPCLVMNASDIDPFKYTHIHYAFGNITSDFDVNDGGYNDQFNDFLALEDVYRVITFGGWAFSTDPLTYMIFRDGTTANNRQTFAQNVVNFVNLYNLDGVDFDWEYPGEPDIPGIPAGSADEGTNYLAFLQELRTLMPSNKTISVAAPASYWYLKQFPIKDIATVVDYIIFMTYDLQGIWDLNNSNAESGCPAGNCLRSDVNLTETLYSLSMITKAGVPANQVMVGVTSYGRSFLMATEGCYGPMCTYTEAGLAGDCTQTAGFISNAEINDIISNNPTAQTMQDSDSNTDILVYNDTQWVGYMSSDTKDSRAQLYQGLNFGGTSEWAIDLEEFEQPTTVVPIDPPCQTVTLSSYPATPDPTDLGTPINGTSYFSITHACFQDTNITNPKFANKAAFMTQAYKDATNLADSSQDWPTYGTDASDLYFGIDTQDSPYASDIAANIKAAANWDNPQWGFDSYIILDCQNKDSPGNCGARAPGDGRSVVCYTNNTYSWFWERSQITCCPPFFTANTLSDVHNDNANSDPDNLDLRYMQTSGSFLLHEMMHANAITADRGHLNDEYLITSTAKIRIYGPQRCAQAARIEKAPLTSKNPDNYAQFASAHYWQKVFGGSVPKPRTNNIAPAGYAEYSYDSDMDYTSVCLAPPEDFNCVCNEDGCTDDAFPCCADSTCSCDCDEDGCSALSPTCCASGTCQYGN